jgi:hypothetical protein
MEETFDVREVELQYLIFCNLLKLEHLEELNKGIESLISKIKKSLEINKGRLNV